MSRSERSHLITTSDAVKVAGVSAVTLHQWARRGYLTQHGTGKLALWDWREIEAVLSAPAGKRRRVA